MTDLRTQAIEVIAEAAPYSAMEWQCADVLEALLDWLTDNADRVTRAVAWVESDPNENVRRLAAVLRGIDA